MRRDAPILEEMLVVQSFADFDLMPKNIMKKSIYTYRICVDNNKNHYTSDAIFFRLMDLMIIIRVNSIQK